MYNSVTAISITGVSVSEPHISELKCGYMDIRICIWQSQVEIERYSIAYFNRVSAFEVLYDRTSINGGAHTHYINS